MTYERTDGRADNDGGIRTDEYTPKKMKIWKLDSVRRRDKLTDGRGQTHERVNRRMKTKTDEGSEKKRRQRTDRQILS